MATSRSVPQQTAQIFSPLAGQKRAGLRLSQIGQDTESPQDVRTIEQNTRCGNKRQNQADLIGEVDVIYPVPSRGCYVKESYQGRQDSRELWKTLSPPRSMPIPMSPPAPGSCPKSPIFSIR